MAKRWAQRPDGSTWGDWGDDDELGRINLLTPQKVLEGAREKGFKGPQPALLAALYQAATDDYEQQELEKAIR